jgi:chromosomal replication initiation ATPase DnaA
MGAAVNLAARLMCSKENNGILVDEAVRAQAGTRFAFRSLPPVKAKGYDKPVPILEPLHSVEKRKKKSSVSFVGRSAEKLAITSIAEKILGSPLHSQSSMVFLMGELGMGKSALALSVIVDVQKLAEDSKSIIATARSTSTETEQRIPLR